MHGCMRPCKRAHPCACFHAHMYALLHACMSACTHAPLHACARALGTLFYAILHTCKQARRLHRQLFRQHPAQVPPVLLGPIPPGSRATRSDAARTPLTERYIERDMAWEHCMDVTSPASLPIRLVTAGTEAGAGADAGARVAPPPRRDASQHKQLPGGCRVGQVTETGRAQAVAFGEWLRKRCVGRLARALGLVGRACCRRPGWSDSWIHGALVGD
eukprot:364483-Chlamydomonas_euryale.AAC.4